MRADVTAHGSWPKNNVRYEDASLSTIIGLFTTNQFLKEKLHLTSIRISLFSLLPVIVSYCHYRVILYKLF